MILSTEHSQVYHAVQEYFVLHKITPKIVADVQDIEVVRQLAVDGAGIAPLNELTVRSASQSEKLIILDKTAKYPIHEMIYIITKKRRRPHPLTEQIIGHFRLTV
jgi:LysR family transcriptional activator of nhaA